MSLEVAGSRAVSRRATMIAVFFMAGRHRRSRVFADEHADPPEGEEAALEGEREDEREDDENDDALADETAPREAEPPRMVEIEGDWVGAMPDAETLALAAKRRSFDVARGRPSEGLRWALVLQVGLVFAGASAWWSLLHFGVNVSVLEIAWFVAAAVGAILLVAGHLRRLTWQTVFGGVTSAGPLLFQMRGADLLLGYGLTTFNALLVALLALSGVLAVLAIREIDAVG